MLKVTFRTPSAARVSGQAVANAIAASAGVEVVTLRVEADVVEAGVNGSWKGSVEGEWDGAAVGFPVATWAYTGPVAAPGVTFDVADAAYVEHLEDDGNDDEYHFGAVEDAAYAETAHLVVNGEVGYRIAEGILAELDLDDTFELGDTDVEDGNTVFVLRPKSYAGERIASDAAAGYFYAEVPESDDHPAAHIGQLDAELSEVMDALRAAAAANGAVTDALTVTYTRVRGGETVPLSLGDVEGILARNNPADIPGSPFGALRSVVLTDTGAVATFDAVDGAGDMVTGAVAYRGTLRFAHLGGDLVTATGGVAE